MSPTVESDGLPWEATFVENMTRARKALGMSQTALAKKLAARGLPFHQPTIQRIEAGERRVQLNEAVAIAHELLMDDLNSAISPNTVESATQTITNYLRTAERDWSYMAETISDVLEQIESQRQNLSAERSFYVRTLLSIGHGRDTELAERANVLLDEMWAVQKSVLDLMQEHFPEDLEGLRKQGRI